MLSHRNNIALAAHAGESATTVLPAASQGAHEPQKQVGGKENPDA
jgi:hypothetical protein